MCQSTTAGPLAGIRVLDLTSVVSGPAAMGVLADQGADVIKIEPPSGDIMRGRGTVTGSGGAGITPGFVACNRGKRSVVLDLKCDGAASVLWRLIDTADVFAQNFRPGVIERLGFGADVVLSHNPRLVFLSISGVGERGPYADKRVYDPVVQALSGLADIQADPLTGRPKMVRTLVADKTTGIYAAQAVSAALFARERSGEGQHIRLAMLDTMVSYLWPEGMAPFTVVADAAHSVSATSHDMIFETSDGYITLGAVSDREWKALCEALARPEWITDPRFISGAARSQNRQERLEHVEAALKGRSTQEMLTMLQGADVPCAPVLSRREVLEHAQIEANELISEFEQSGLGVIRQARPAARFDKTPALIPRPAPRLGEHTDAVLAELGYDESTRAELQDAGIVNGPTAG
jgi:crotonobetainyl-CoA:carnitine CoA-transferase CaiB-like acyl-CoA transferase